MRCRTGSSSKDANRKSYPFVYYPKPAASAVADCLTRHDWARLRSIAQSQVPAIRLVAYHTPDEGFVACQAFEYVELEERPLTELHIVRSGHEA